MRLGGERINIPVRKSFWVFGALIAAGCIGGLIFAITQVSSNSSAMLYIVPFYIVLMVFLVVLFVVPQRVLKYQLEGQELRIQYWYGHCSINLQNSKLEIVRVKTAWRSFGISTGFYNAGLFRVNSEDVRIYGTNLEDGVVLIRRAKNITLITPADPHEFLRLVSRV